jgi:hypothetical protein
MFFQIFEICIKKLIKCENNVKADTFYFKQRICQIFEKLS